MISAVEVEDFCCEKCNLPSGIILYLYSVAYHRNAVNYNALPLFEEGLNSPQTPFKKYAFGGCFTVMDFDFVGYTMGGLVFGFPATYGGNY